MNQELRTWTNGIIDTIQNVTDRINSNTLSESDRNSVGIMLVQLERAISNSPEYVEDSTIITKLQESFSALMDNNAALLQKNHDEMHQIMLWGNVLVTNEDYQRFAPREDGRTYIDLELPQMQNDKFMEYVEHLKSIGAKFDAELKQWYVEADWELKKIEKERKDDEMEYRIYYEDKLIGEGTLYGDDLKIDRALELANVDIKELTADTQFDWGKIKIENKNKGYVYSWDFFNVDIEKREAYFTITAYEDGKIAGYQDYDAVLEKDSNKIVEVFSDNGRYNDIAEMLTPAIEKVINEKAKQLALNNEKENDIMINEHEVSTSTQENFRAVYYENNERQELFAETRESAIAQVRETKNDIKSTDRCYIQELNADGKYQQEGIYLITSGRDVTPVEIKLPYMSSEAFIEVTKGIKEMGAKYAATAPEKMWYVERSASEETMKSIQSIIDSHDNNIYLKMPYMTPGVYKEVARGIKEMGAKYNSNKKMWYMNYNAPKEAVDSIKSFIDSHDEATYLRLPDKLDKQQFHETIDQLKQDGARYNPDKKAWYITDKQDKSKFAAYLPSEKPSVLGKLEQNKESAAKNNQDYEKDMEPRNKDNHERA